MFANNPDFDHKHRNAISGNNELIKKAISKKRSILSKLKTHLHLILSVRNGNKERDLWLNDIHNAVIRIYSQTNNDIIHYAWQNIYRIGNIFHAVYNCDQPLIKQLIADEKIDINDNLKYVYIYLYFHIILINIFHRDSSGHNLLHIASSVNNIDFLQLYGKNFEVDGVDVNGWTALRIACDNNNYECTKYIVDELWPNLDIWYPTNKSLNPSTINYNEMHDDRSILHELAIHDKTRIMSVLLRSQINMESVDECGLTPLHLAAKWNREKSVICLLQNGSHINLGDWKGNRSIHLTTKIQVARWLVAFGARLDLMNIMNKNGAQVWNRKCDKYLSIMQMFTGDNDCKIQTGIPSQSWFDDKLSSNCLACSIPFTKIAVRRHHCRSCGLLVCGQCSTHKLRYVSDVDGKMNHSLERACDKCFNKALCMFDHTNKYTFQGVSYNMIPKEFLRLAILETHKKGSYAEFLEAEKMEEEEERLRKLHTKEYDQNIDESKENEECKNSNNNNSLMAIIKGGHSRSTTNNSFFSMVGNVRNKSKKNIKKPMSISYVNSAHSMVGNAAMKAAENLEMLKDINVRSAQMVDSAKNFSEMAKELEQQQKKSSFFGIL